MTKRIVTASGAVAGFAVALGTAGAQPSPDPPPVDEATTSPGFVSLQRFDSRSRAGSALSVSPDHNNRFWLVFDMHAQYVHPESFFGGYVQLPLHLDFHSPYAGHEGRGTTYHAGNLEVGGTYSPRLGWLGIAVAVAVTLPTEATSDDDPYDGYDSEFLPAIRGVGPHEGCCAWTTPWTLRAMASPMVRRGRVFVRLDLGVAAFSDFADRMVFFVHTGLGAGVELGPVAIAAEVSTSTLLRSPGSDDYGTRPLVPGVSMRGTGRVQPFGGVFLHFDGNYRPLPVPVVGLDVRI